MGAFEATPPLIAILCALVEERAGLHYGPADQEVLVDKVSDRALEAGFESLLDYYYFLRYDAQGEEELAKLIDSLVVNETYFFREYQQLEVVVGQFLEPAVREGRRPRVWSAACATGEEPLTLALMLADRGILPEVELVASDISQRALDRARAGRFGRRSLRSVPDATLVQRWMREAIDGTVSVVPEVGSRIQWKHLNLLDAARVQGLGLFDLILCRNALIYFSDTTAAHIVNMLAAQLKPGAPLFVSVSESLLRFDTRLSCEESNRVFFYRNAAT